ncbi:hypothetical protein ACFLSX_04785 [Calditrichota bacterium]
MLDKIEFRIAKDLADRHFYPFAQNNYISIFRSFSHFPLNLKDVGITADGTTITYIALVVFRCKEQKKNEFSDFFNSILTKMKNEDAKDINRDITVETFLGCLLYYYHPAQLRNKLSSINIKNFMDEKHIYEYNLKKKTILLYAI